MKEIINGPKECSFWGDENLRDVSSNLEHFCELLYLEYVLYAFYIKCVCSNSRKWRSKCDCTLLSLTSRHSSLANKIVAHMAPTWEDLSLSYKASFSFIKHGQDVNKTVTVIIYYYYRWRKFKKNKSASSDITENAYWNLNFPALHNIIIMT